ncbi:unnamed protein product [Brugia timori]|uniref:Uncharacterized protein n=1 Tax=Brugia timori TaxID=42155 RepID=A0A0R3QJZ8_9BILA|nr:unnamed protein product [Brugia timori]
MNMVRIRQIIALRKALKAGPLLPPISKRLYFEFLLKYISTI